MARVDRGRLSVLLSLLILVSTTFLGGAVAQDELQTYVEPATPQAESIRSLFNLTFVIAIVIFLGVEALLLFVLWKFRNNRAPPAEDGHRGHTTAEVVWTVIPAGILLFLGVVSAGTLFELDTVPDDVDLVVDVQASQWGWKFTYPDGNFSQYFWDGTARTTVASAEREYNVSKQCRDDGNCRGVPVGEFRVEEGARVQLNIEAVDVIHALWIPEFGVKIDAVPGRTNIRWFEAPAFDPNDDNEYFLQCAEFCGRGHHAMHAKIVVVPAGTFENGQPTPKVTAPAEEPPAADAAGG